jgi:hypothetical protein
VCVGVCVSVCVRVCVCIRSGSSKTVLFPDAREHLAVHRNWANPKVNRSSALVGLVPIPNLDIA